MAGKASKMNERLNFKSVEELLGVVNEESAMDIEICSGLLEEISEKNI